MSILSHFKAMLIQPMSAITRLLWGVGHVRPTEVDRDIDAARRRDED